jgi:serine/threonine protein kinase
MKYMFHNEAKIFMLFETIRGVPLLDYLKEHELRLDEYQLKFYATEIVDAMGHIESSGFIYRDFKPDNVLLTKTGHVVLTVYDDDSNDVPDFRFASPSFLCSYLYQLQCELSLAVTEETHYSVVFSAPEAVLKMRHRKEAAASGIHILEDEEEDKATIWWSLGVFFYTCLVGKHPFKSGAPSRQNDLVRLSPPPIPNTLSPTLRSFIYQVRIMRWHY